MELWWSLLAVLACLPDATPRLLRSWDGRSAPAVRARSEQRSRYGQATSDRIFTYAERPIDDGDASEVRRSSRLPRNAMENSADLVVPSLNGAEVIDELDARPGKWKWMVAFGRWTESGLGEWFCGGSLITRQYVLTSSHCLRPDDVGHVGARIGDDDLSIRTETAHQQRNISGVVQHPQHFVSLHDLALVRLDTPVELTRSVQTISLPPAGAEHVGQYVEAAGWGTVQFLGESTTILREVPLCVTDPTACEAAYQRVPLFQTHFPGGFQDTKVCARSRDELHRDACEGDAGGPLVVQLGDGTYQLVGVLSAGFGCGNPEFPGLYTKVSAYIDWITDQLH